MVNAGGRIPTPVCGLARNDNTMPVRSERGTDCHTSDVGHWFAMTGTSGAGRNDRTIGGWFAMDGGNAFSGGETEKESPEGLSFYSSI